MKVKPIPSNTSIKNNKDKLSFMYLFIFLLAIAVYGWTYTFDFSMDDGYIRDIVNDINKNWTGIGSIFSQRLGDDYRPISNLSFWLEDYIFGDLKPNISHLINTVLFAILSTLIFRFLLIMNLIEDKNKAIALALVTVILFVVHPMYVSVVANIKSRDNLLSMLFGILGAIQIVHFFNSYKKWRILSFLLFIIIANFAKRDAYFFLLFPLLYFLFFKNHLFNKKTLTRAFLYTIISCVIFFIIRSIVSEYYIGKDIASFTYSDSPLTTNDSLINRISFSLTTMWYYLKFFIVPFGYHSYYGYNQIPLNSLFSPLNIISVIAYISILIFSIFKYKKQKLYLFSFLFYLLAIAYAANLVYIISGAISDRYNFIGSLGLCLFTATLIVEYSKTSNWKIILKPWFILLIIILIGFNFYRAKDWKNSETLFLSDIKNGSQSAQVHQMLSSIYLNEALFANISIEEKDKKMLEAVKYIDKGLEISQINPMLLENKGISLIYYTQPDSAKTYFRKALQVDSTINTNINHLGLCFRNENNLDSALYYFGIAMNKDAIFGYAANNYVEMLIKQQRLNSVDSVIKILNNRFPTDKYLKQKTEDLNQKGIWYVY